MTTHKAGIFTEDGVTTVERNYYGVVEQSKTNVAWVVERIEGGAEGYTAAELWLRRDEIDTIVREQTKAGKYGYSARLTARRLSGQSAIQLTEYNTGAWTATLPAMDWFTHAVLDVWITLRGAIERFDMDSTFLVVDNDYEWHKYAVEDSVTPTIGVVPLRQSEYEALATGGIAHRAIAGTLSDLESTYGIEIEYEFDERGFVAIYIRQRRSGSHMHDGHFTGGFEDQRLHGELGAAG